MFHIHACIVLTALQFLRSLLNLLLSLLTRKHGLVFFFSCVLDHPC